MSLGPDEIVNRFGFHKATEVTGTLHRDVRRLHMDLASALDLLLPDSREKALAFTHLQESAMWSNAAIACNLAPLVDED